MHVQSFSGGRGLLTASMLAGLAAVAAYALTRTDPWIERTAEVKAVVKSMAKADPARPRPSSSGLATDYREIAPISLGLTEPRALAVGPDARIYVAGDQAIEVYAADGRRGETITLEGKPACLTVSSAARGVQPAIYVGVEGDVLRLDPDGRQQARWAAWNDRALLTALASMGNDLFAADAGNHVVLHYNASGELVGRIGDTKDDREVSGFVVPSAYFDLVGVPPDRLCVVNPGMLRVETYTLDGQLQSFWGRAGSARDDFFGCCNPAHLARLPDGRLVTSEKGIPRIKIFSPLGDLQTLVAGPVELTGTSVAEFAVPEEAGGHPVFDVAADGTGRILVLDTALRRVRIFVADAPSRS